MLANFSKPLHDIHVRDLLTEPAWTDEDLGMPIPDDKHAVSVCLPTWDSIIGYEEALEKVTSRMQCGYPRFFRHPAINRLFAEAREHVCEAGEVAIVFPHLEAAQRAHFFVEKRISAAVKITSYESFQCLIVSEEHFPIAMEYWRYTGEIVSSRRATDLFNGRIPALSNTTNLLDKLAAITTGSAENIYLYENGMAAAFAAFRSVISIRPNKKTLQLEFPYVDVLKIQQNFGTGVVYLNECDDEPFWEALKRIQQGEFAAVFCELPSNPLLRSVDLEKISQACKEGGVLLVVDDTICSSYNIDVSKFADITTTSLTKWVSGKGDVMAGSIKLNPQSSYFTSLQQFFKADNPSHSKLYVADSIVLEQNLEGFAARMQQVNGNGKAIAELLHLHPEVANVWYPLYNTQEEYSKLMTSKGGFGGLISFALKSPKKAPKVFDSLKITKGPSLGTEFSLACPYTLLAHYDELEWVENCGVPTNLIRVSIGIEPLDTLLDAFNTALSHA